VSGRRCRSLKKYFRARTGRSPNIAPRYSNSYGPANEVRRLKKAYLRGQREGLLKHQHPRKVKKEAA
jgi:hypothetical protein